jgi:molybdopterin converting factor subunit 1
MTVTVRYFAMLRDQRGLESETVESNWATVGELVANLAQKHQFSLPSSRIRSAVNGAFADDNLALTDGDSVVLIPPVAGG